MKNLCVTPKHDSTGLNTRKSAYIQLRQISSICHFLTPQATQTLVCALIISRLDYCNCLLAGCPLYLIDRMQKVQNAAARLIFKAKKSYHIKPILQSLYWLPIRARMQYKICTTCFNAITGSGPQYLSELPYLPPPSRPLTHAYNSSFGFKNIWGCHFHTSVPLPGIICRTISAILTSILLLNRP